MQTTYNVKDLNALTQAALQDTKLSNQAQNQVLETLGIMQETLQILSDDSSGPIAPAINEDNLFADVDRLEGNLSRGQITRLREQVIQEKAGFFRYVELMEFELNGLEAVGNE